MAFSNGCVAPVRAMKTIAAAMVASAALAATAHAQLNTHQIAYGGAGDDMARGGIVRTADGNLMLVGEGAGAAQAGGVMVVKLDPCGDTLWTRIYDFGIEESGRKIRLLPDQGFVVVGSFRRNEASSRDAFLLKIDAAGSVVWLREYGNPSSAAPDEGRDVRVGDGGYIYAAGTTRSSGAGGDDGWIWKVDGSGVLQWSRTYGGTGDDMLRSLDVRGDSVVAVGRTLSFGASGKGWTVGVDPGSGGYRWSHWEDDVDDLTGVAIGPTGGTFVSVGRRALSAFASESVLATGARTGAIRIEPGAGESLALEEVRPIDGDWYAAGTWHPAAAASQIYLARIAPGSGSVSLGRYFGGGMEEEGFSLCEAYDRDGDGLEELAIAGFTSSFGSGGRDAYVVGATRWGVSGCNEGEVPYSLKVDGAARTAVVPVVSPYVTGGAIASQVGRNVPATIICRSCVRGASGLSEEGSIGEAVRPERAVGR